MFTGIITDIGQVIAKEAGQETTFSIATRYATESLWVGQSIACNGVCLTVTRFSADPLLGSRFEVQVSQETLSKTTLGGWKSGTWVNLEKALTLQQDISGHLVSGHVDAVAEITAMQAIGGSTQYTITVPQPLKRYIATKGSVTLDGVSLTVNSVENNRFMVNIIPHTQEVTNWSRLNVGDSVNLEIDLIARYVERLLQPN